MPHPLLQLLNLIAIAIELVFVMAVATYALGYTIGLYAKELIGLLW